MKKAIAQKIASRKRGILSRLERAVRVEPSPCTQTLPYVQYDLADRARGIAHGGIGAVTRLVRKLGLAEEIDSSLFVLKLHRPYRESDHVLNIALNAVVGGRTLDDIELRRNDAAYLDALGVEAKPDPTTEGDYCRRYQPYQIAELQAAFNRARLRVWQQQPPSFFEMATVDADGTLVPTDGACKEGMDIAYDGTWGYHALVVSLANTQEPLFILNRSGNRPSHEGVPPVFDASIALCREAGFKKVRLRGDTDFTNASHLDRWDDDGVEFIFGIDARQNLKRHADDTPFNLYAELQQRAERVIATHQRTRPTDVKDEVVRRRGFETLRGVDERVVSFDYRPGPCQRTYRVVALRKTIEHTSGQTTLFDEVRYFFYITNVRTLSDHDVVHQARARCNQENLLAQLKSGVYALRAPVNTLNANWAYMVMASLAWSLKAWLALMVPISPRWVHQHQKERQALLSMEFRRFTAALINIPAQVVKTGRRIVLRLLAWNPWQHVFFRLLDAL